MRRMSVANQKGGVGKTTTAVCGAGAFTKRGAKTLLIDLDPQRSASDWLQDPADDPAQNDPGQLLLNVLERGESLEPLVVKTRSGIDLVPCGPAFAGIERLTKVGMHRLLAKSMKALPESWDLVIIDTPPSLGPITIMGLVASDGCLIPVEAKFLTIKPVAHLLQTLQEIRDELGHNMEIWGVVPTLVDDRTKLSRQIQQDFRDGIGELVLRSTIRQNTSLAEAPGFHVPIDMHAPHSAGAKDFEALAIELADRIGIKLKEVTNGD